jgi:dienelactone hydrolase
VLCAKLIIVITPLNPLASPVKNVVILIHEWWGLNDHIKAMAEEVSSKGFHALAIDLFQGSVATDRDGAMQ